MNDEPPQSHFEEKTPEKVQDKPQEKSWIEKIIDLFSSTPSTREEVNSLLEAAVENQVIGQDEFSIIEGAMEVTEIQARDVMVPRTQMKVVEINTASEEFLKTIMDSGHSRFPVIGDSIDDVRGILLAKDLLPLIHKENLDDFDMESILRPAFRVPESKRLNKLLRIFREKRNHLALVVDEYDSISGLITIEDILEEIVGEIEDEFDVSQDTHIKKLGTNDFIIQAQMSIEEFNEHFDAKLESDDAETIAGLLTEKMGYIPHSGESVSLSPFLFKVIHSDNRRIHLLRIFTKNSKK